MNDKAIILWDVIIHTDMIFKTSQLYIFIKATGKGSEYTYFSKYQFQHSRIFKYK